MTSNHDLNLDLRSLGQNPSEDSVSELLEEFDFNGDGAIDFEEFLLLMAEQMAKPGKYPLTTHCVINRF